MPDGEDLDSHPGDRLKRRRLVLRQFRLLTSGCSGESTIQPGCRREVLRSGDHRTVAVAVPLEGKEPGPALDQIKEHTRVPAVLGRRELDPSGKRYPDGKDLLFHHLPDRPAGEDLIVCRAMADRLGLFHVFEHPSILLDGIVDPGRQHPVHHLVVTHILDLCEPPDAPFGDGADTEFSLRRQGPVLDRFAEVRGRGLQDLLKVVGERDVVEEEDGSGTEAVVVVERFVRDGAFEFVIIRDEVLHRRAGMGLPLSGVAGDGDVQPVRVLDRLGGKRHHEALRDGSIADVFPVERVEEERERVAAPEDLKGSFTVFVRRRRSGLLLLHSP